MTEGIITLSHAELDRVSVIRSIISRQLTQAQAAQRLQLSIRQVKRLTRAYRTCGAAGMASKHRGRCPGAAITVCADFNGAVTLLHKGKALALSAIAQLRYDLIRRLLICIG